MILYLDTNVLVYSIAANDDLREPTQRWLDWHAQQPGALLVTSRLTVLEALVGPMKSPDKTRLQRTEAALDSLLILDMAKKYLLPWNWFRGHVAVEAMISRLEAAFPFKERTLDHLPEQPRFVFCGTDMAFGASFVFDRERVGSYLAGYAPPQSVPAPACA